MGRGRWFFCAGATIRIGREMLCLPHAGFSTWHMDHLKAQRHTDKINQFFYWSNCVCPLASLLLFGLLLSNAGFWLLWQEGKFIRFAFYSKLIGLNRLFQRFSISNKPVSPLQASIYGRNFPLYAGYCFFELMMKNKTIPSKSSGQPKGPCSSPSIAQL